MAVRLEAPLDLPPRMVEMDRSLQVATRFVRMHANNLFPVKVARLFQNLQVINGSRPKRAILLELANVKHPVRNADGFQQPDYFQGIPRAVRSLAP